MEEVCQSQFIPYKVRMTCAYCRVVNQSFSLTLSEMKVAKEREREREE